MVDSVMYIVKKGIEKSNIDNKIIENSVCVLRNLSYRDLHQKNLFVMSDGPLPKLQLDYT